MLQSQQATDKVIVVVAIDTGNDIAHIITPFYVHDAQALSHGGKVIHSFEYQGSEYTLLNIGDDCPLPQRMVLGLQGAIEALIDDHHLFD